MKKISICDVTMSENSSDVISSLSFREKIELSKILDKNGVDYIEFGLGDNLKTDGLLIKSVVTAVSNTGISVKVPVEGDGVIEYIWNCLSSSVRPRLKVSLPVSAVQMEYLYHKKPDAMLELIGSKVKECSGYCKDVVFSAVDAGRSDRDFLIKALICAVENGAGTLILCDTAGNMLPEEMSCFVSDVKSALGDDIKIGVSVSNSVYMADSCAVYAVKAGADEVEVSSYGDDLVSILKFATAVKTKADYLDVSTGVDMTGLATTLDKINSLFSDSESDSSVSSFNYEDDFMLSSHDDINAISESAKKLGYELSDEDISHVYDAFKKNAEKKEGISAKELNALIASSAMQVPARYSLDSYVINSGNIIPASSQISLTDNGETVTGISGGDGPIDASFRAIEQITGTHYELDDFQIQSVTEGREAMGETVIRLRSNGKLYSGRGISTDIVGSSILAYINALNKIVYEEDNSI